MIAGKRILITRPPHQAQTFAERLRQLDAEPILLPLISIEAAAPFPDLSGYAWVIFTSANAVMQIPDGIQFPRVAAVGMATAEALLKKGIRVDFIPTLHTADSLSEEMVAVFSLAGVKILLPQGNLTRPTLANRLRQAGARVDEVIVYRTVRPPIDPSLIAQPLDVITFTSPSAVQHFVEVFPFNQMGRIQLALGFSPVESSTALKHDVYMEHPAKIACLGPVTAAAAREAGLPVHMTAHPSTIEGLIQAIIAYFQGRTL